MLGVAGSAEVRMFPAGNFCEFSVTHGRSSLLEGWMSGSRCTQGCIGLQARLPARVGFFAIGEDVAYGRSGFFEDVGVSGVSRVLSSCPFCARVVVLHDPEG